jgi:hypothetical protein
VEAALSPIRIFILSVILFFGLRALAETACEKLDHACANAGYVRGLPDPSAGKDLETKCVQPLLKGQTVADVNVDPDVIKDCADSKIKSAPRSKHRRH